MRHPLAARLGWMLHNCYRPAQMVLDPGLACASVALIDPDMREVGKRLLDAP